MSYHKIIHALLVEAIRDCTVFGSFLFTYPLLFIVFGTSDGLFIPLSALIIGELLGFSIKYFYPKQRPNKQPYTNIIEKIDAGSFPSIHTYRATVVYLTFFFLFQGAFSKIIFLLVIPLVGFSRIYLQKHDLIDVLGGFLLGTTVLYLLTIF